MNCCITFEWFVYFLWFFESFLWPMAITILDTTAYKKLMGQNGCLIGPLWSSHQPESEGHDRTGATWLFKIALAFAEERKIQQRYPNKSKEKYNKRTYNKQNTMQADLRVKLTLTIMMCTMEKNKQTNCVPHLPWLWNSGLRCIRQASKREDLSKPRFGRHIAIMAMVAMIGDVDHKQLPFIGLSEASAYILDGSQCHLQTSPPVVNRWISGVKESSRHVVQVGAVNLLLCKHVSIQIN